MTRLPWLFRTRSRVPDKKSPITADIIVLEIISDDCLFYIDKVCCVTTFVITEKFVIMTALSVRKSADRVFFH